MFPWVYGFEWTAGNVIFLGLFFSVVIVILTTVAVAVVRSRRAFKERRHHEVKWESTFEDLGSEARPCRHQLSGETDQRMCRHGFECKDCSFHKQMLDSAYKLVEAESDRYYHRGHAWVRKESYSTVIIGLDDFATRIVGPKARAKLPKIGRMIHENGTAWRFLLGDESVRVLAPVSGQVIEHGGPDRGWYLKVKLLDQGADLRHLLTGNEVNPWMEYEMARLIRMIPESCQAGLTEDGQLVDDVTAKCPSLEWDLVCSEILLEP